MSKGEETRQRIIEQAAGLFNQRGFEGSVFSELMQTTGLQKGGIYRHFSSKEELPAEAFDYAWDLAREFRMPDLDPKAGSIAQLKQLVANFVERQPPIPGGCPLLNTAVDADDGNPILRDWARKALADWKRRLGATVERGIEAGEVRADIRPEAVATVMISSLEGALMMSRLERNAKPLRVVQENLSGFLENQVRA